MGISKEYVLYAEERLKNCERERGRVLEELSKHIVKETFRERKERGKYTGPYAPKDQGKKLF
ncbi:MAG: hypothetical protein ACK4OF_00030 [Aquificaceae bacterium]